MAGSQVHVHGEAASEEERRRGRREEEVLIAAAPESPPATADKESWGTVWSLWKMSNFLSEEEERTFEAVSNCESEPGQASFIL